MSRRFNTDIPGRLAEQVRGSLSEIAKDSSQFVRRNPVFIMDPDKKHVFEIGALRLDPSERVLMREGSIVALTPKVFETLLALVENEGHVVDKEELLKRVWPDTFVEEANLAKNVSVLRKVLVENGLEDSCIETVPKRGYRFLGLRNGKPDEDDNGGAPAIVEIQLTDDPVDAAPRRRIRPLVLAAAAAVSVFVAAVLLFWTRPANDAPANRPIRSIAILPLENVSGDGAQDYFSEGMTEALITELAKIQSVTVMSRNSTSRYKGAQKTVQEIARELNVDAVAIGSTYRSGDRARVTLQLYRADTGQNIWSQSYEPGLGDVVTSQGRVARDIADNIEAKLSTSETANLKAGTPVNPAAEDAYLKGLFYRGAGRNSSGAEARSLRLKSIAEFERAIALEPSYAAAYGNAASEYVGLALQNPEYFPKAKEMALATLRLDDANAVGHAALAVILWRHEWDRAGAEREFDRAYGLDRNAESKGVSGWSLFLSATGQNENAIREMKRAEQVNPFDVQIKFQIGNNLLRARQYDLAIDKFSEVTELNPGKDLVPFALGVALAFKGNYPEAIAQIQKGIALSGNPRHAIILAWIYARSGRRDEAVGILEEVKKSPEAVDQYTGGMGIARVYAALGENDQAIYWLEKDFAARTPYLIWLGADAAFDPIRDDPRFQEMLGRLGLGS